MPDWSEIQAKIGETLGTDPDVFHNAFDLIEALSSIAVPPALEPGFIPTIRFVWPNLEIEVFIEHYELYRFPEGALDVKHFPHWPGEVIPAELVDAVTSAHPCAIGGEPTG